MVSVVVRIGAAALLSCLACAGPAVAAVDLARHPAALKTVPPEDRPKWRWWWPAGALDDAELDRELEAMKAAGFGGAEQVLLRSPGDWWTPAFRASTKHALEKATSLGLKFDPTLGPEWPISSQAVTPQLGMQEALFSSADVLGPTTYLGPPQPIDPLNGGQRLVAVTAARVTGPGLANPLAGKLSAPIRLDGKTAVDLTPLVRGGALTWNAPAGHWLVVATYMRPTGQRPHGDVVGLVGATVQMNTTNALPDVAGQLGPLVPDHFSRAATDATLADYDKTLFGGDMAALLRANGSHVFEDSLELNHTAPIGIPLTNFPDGCAVCTNKFWTPSFLEEFKRRRGYDLARVLPAIFEPFDYGDAGRVRADYDRTLSELLIDNHYEAIRDWANARGLRSRAQGYNLLGTDKTAVSAALQLPDTESLDDGETGDAVAPGSDTSWTIMDDYRSVVSAAHISGAREVGLEAGANLIGEYDMSADDYKVIADRAFAAGVTTMVLHGFAYKDFHDVYSTWTWPGWSAFSFLFAQSWNEDAPQMKLWSGLAGYFGRISAALKSGRPSVDVTVLSQQHTPHTFGTPTLAAALRRGSFTADRVDDATLATLGVKGKRLGPGYRALIIDAMPALSGATAAKVLAAARRGVPVVVSGVGPARGTGYKDAVAEDAAVKAAFTTLMALPNVRRVTNPDAVAAALRTLGVRPELSRGDAPLVAQHRRTKTGDVWLLYNNSGRATDVRARFATTGLPSQIDPWTGLAMARTDYTRAKGSVTLPIRLAAGQTMLLAFGNGRRGGHVVRPAGDGVEVKGPWKLSVRTVGPDGDATVGLTLDALRDWRDIAQLSSASGTGEYTASVDVPATWLKARRAVLLDPGRYGGMAEFFVNGHRAALPSVPDGPRDIRKHLHPGANELRVVLATSLANVIVGRAQMGDLRYALFLTHAKQPAGLVGPVRLTPARPVRSKRRLR